MAGKKSRSLADTAHELSSDIEQVLQRHLGELRDDLMDELGKVTTAGAAFGGGLGMTALGTILGGIGFVHLLHRVTGVPLWACYAGSSAVACATGAGLFAIGAEKASEVELIPGGNGRGRAGR